MKIIYITLALLGGAMLLVIAGNIGRCHSRHNSPGIKPGTRMGRMATGKTGRRGREGQLKNA